jgi:hypothetical protein
VRNVTLTGTWEEMQVEAKLVYGDKMGDPDVAMTTLAPYAEEIRVYAPSGADISDDLSEHRLNKIEEMLIEEAKE